MGISITLTYTCRDVACNVLPTDAHVLLERRDVASYVSTTGLGGTQICLVTLVIFGLVTPTGRVAPMTLSSMVVSRDWQEVSVLECILGGLHMDVSVECEPERALEHLTHSKVDALIVDCDLTGSSKLFRALQAKGNQFNTVPLVIMGGPQCVSSRDETGALFAFEKPISVEQAVRTLSAARCMILDGRLRYHRIGLEVPVMVKHKDRVMTDAQLINVSQGGMRLQTDRAFDEDDLQISCELPGSESMLKAQAEVVWRDESGNIGVRFVKIPQQHQRALQLWLAQQFLAN